MALSSCCWSNLPEELLDEIFAHQEDGLDVLRCRHVSVYWRFVATVVYLRKYSIPLLLTISNNGEDPSSLLNILTNKTQILHLPEVHGRRWICTTNYGCLLTMDLVHPHAIHLLNPVSRNQIRLPTINSLMLGNREFPLEDHIKMCCCSSRNLDENCIVLIIHGIDHTLSFCRPGDEVWTALDNLGTFFSYIVFYEGQFYALSKYCTIVCVDLATKPKSTTILPFSVNYVIGAEKYLVESSSGDLVLVCRKDEYWKDDPISFEIYKLTSITKEWTRVSSLGDQALFIGCRSALMANSGGSGSLLRSNCIYFFSSSSHYPQHGGFGNLLVYDMRTKSTEMLYFPNWITPNI